MDRNIILIMVVVALLVCCVIRNVCVSHNAHTAQNAQNAQNADSIRERFIDDYYSLNWTSPDLTNYVNIHKVGVSGSLCSCSNKSRCTYSMSCDYTDDTAHPDCFAGYDRPGDGDIEDYARATPATPATPAAPAAPPPRNQSI